VQLFSIYSLALKFLIERISEQSCFYNVGEIDNRCQFQQHFMLDFLFWVFCPKNFNAKAARKMLVKLTTGWKKDWKVVDKWRHANDIWFSPLQYYLPSALKIMCAYFSSFLSPIYMLLYFQKIKFLRRLALKYEIAVYREKVLLLLPKALKSEFVLKDKELVWHLV
jgi:hypothetical protein